jgi:enamine deaminase RidA (YjgF/YER057c/UK114 family)
VFFSFQVVSYHVPLTEEALITIKTCFERYMPTHKPLWTCVEVSKLGDPGMEVEIEVIAHVKVSSA